MGPDDRRAAIRRPFDLADLCDESFVPNNKNPPASMYTVMRQACEAAYLGGAGAPQAWVVLATWALAGLTPALLASRGKRKTPTT